jgi:hypothetical protein
MICIHCGSTNIEKHAKYVNKNGVVKQPVRCRDCGKGFNFGDDTVSVETKFPAVLFMDIETLPLIGYMWSPWEQDVHPEMLIKDWCVLSWSAKWIDDERMIYDVLTPKEALSRNDKRIVGGLWKLMDDADIIIAQNGKKFDIAKMNTRFWRYQMPHYSSFKVIDTLDVARRTFGLTYNGLDQLAEYLGAGKKLKTEFSLWRQCDEGNQEALGYMSTYNQADVTLLESVYMKMRAWIPNHPRFTAYEKVVGVCPVCMDVNFRCIGLYQAPVRQYKEFRCDHCGSIWHNTKAEK